METTDNIVVPPQGSFTVSLGNVKCTNLVDGDAMPSYWANIDVCTGPESSGNLWWSGSPDTIHRTNTTIISIDALDNEELQSFNYSQPSKTFALSDVNVIPMLSASLIRVSLYEGAQQDKEVDKLIRTIDLSLRGVILSMQLDKTIQFSEGLDIDIAVGFDVAFVEYFKGSKALSIQTGTIRKLPQEWKIVPKEGEDLAALIASTESNSAKYTAAVHFPVIDEAPFQIQLEGRLGIDNETTDDDDKWQVSLLPSDQSILWFLPKVHVEKFMEWLEGKSTASVVIQRTQGVDVWTASSNLSFSQILNPGVESYSYLAPLTQGPAPTRESLEEAVSKATGNDEKKKAQAALNDYENTLTRIAGQASCYLSASTNLELKVNLLPGAWIPLPPVPSPPAMTLEELIPPRAPLPQYPHKDAQLAMHKELRRIISMLMKEYDRLFLPSEHDDEEEDEDDEYTLSKEDRRQKLIFHLNSEGIYFDFKEKLKKALVAVIREKYPTVVEAATASGNVNPLGGQDPEIRKDRTEFYAQLYSYLMEEVHVILNGVFHGVEVHETEDVSPQALLTKLIHLKKQAWESEVNGQVKKATTIYMDRLNLVDTHLQALSDMRATVWYEFALFYFRTQELSKAGESLRTCISIDPSHIHAIQAYGALLCQNREFEAADIVLKNALNVQPAPNSIIQARGHGLLALYYTTSQSDFTGNLRLHELMQAVVLTKSLSATFPSPSSVCIDIAAYCRDLGLYSLAYEALALSDFVMKPKTVLSVAMISTKKLVCAAIDLHFGNLGQANQWCQEALDHDNTFADGWYLHGLIASRQNSLQVALSSYAQALGYIEKLHETYQLPLFLQLGALYLHHQQWGSAKAIFLRACQEVSVSSAWLGVGVVCVRQDDWEGAEMALAEANILDHTNPEVWGYLALVCLNATPPRVREAELALQQALRYDMKNAVLLRELSNGFVALDKLELAETLLRRSLITADSSITRKTLADVLSAQNCAETALEQYQKALEGCESMGERTKLLYQCAELLTTLGRLEDAKEYRNMALHQQEGAENEALIDHQLQQRLESSPQEITP